MCHVLYLFYPAYLLVHPLFHFVSPGWAIIIKKTFSIRLLSVTAVQEKSCNEKEKGLGERITTVSFSAHCPDFHSQR